MLIVYMSVIKVVLLFLIISKAKITKHGDIVEI